MIHQAIPKTGSGQRTDQPKTSASSARLSDHPMQRRSDGAPQGGHNFADVAVHRPDHQPAAHGQPQAPSNQTGLPDALKAGVEQLAGISLDDVRVHYNSAKPAQLDALAFAQGRDIHVAPGQEQHLPHEAWHVVQQAQGRVQPTIQIEEGVAVNDNAGLEREADAMGAKTVQPEGGMRDLSDQQNQAVHTTGDAGGIHTAQVLQLVKHNGWTKAKAARYREHLIRRGTLRGQKGKPVGKLVRKAVNARKLADPHFKGLRLADAPSAGHHVPALAMANKRSGTMPYGKRGSSTEKRRLRPYFRGTQDERENAHGIVHEAETFAGLGSRNAAKFSGTDKELARLQRLSAAGLTLDDGITPIRVDVQTQAKKEAGKRSRYEDIPLEEAKETIFEEEHGLKKPKTEEWLEDSTDSEPESDEENWISDSDDE
jgi:hypothetical protein